MIPTTPGIYENLSYEQYAAIPAMSRTLLAKLADTPADAQEYILGGGDTSATLEFGIGAHCLMLEPARFSSTFAIGPDVKLNTSAGKAEWADFSARNHSKTLVRGADGVDLIGMRKRLFEHPLAGGLLSGSGMNEVVVVWKDESTGALCKIRIDRLAWDGHGALDVLDYKTTSDASRSGFPKSYGQFLYYMQEAFYTDGVTAAYGAAPARFLFIAQEKKRPYKCNVFQFPEHRVEQGRKLYRDLLEVHATCVKNAQWPALDGREYLRGVVQEEVPEFAMKAVR